MRIADRLPDRLLRLAGEVNRFFWVAIGATIVALTLFNVLAYGFPVGPALLEDHVLPAYVVAHGIGMVISYFGTRAYVFPDRSPAHADGGWTAYVVINVAAMAIPVACLAISRYLLGLQGPFFDNLVGNGIGLFLAFVARFYLNRRFVFVGDAHRPGASTAHTG